MTTYMFEFQNDTTSTWTVCLFQTIPNSGGLQSIAWMQNPTPQSGRTTFQWAIDYNVAVGQYVQSGGNGVYETTQILPAQLGGRWQAVYASGAQQLQYVGPGGAPNEITIQNNSSIFANLGIGMSGQASLYQYQVNSGATAQFDVTPTYWVGLFDNLEPGEVISTNVAVGPLMVQYPTGLAAATLKATLSGSSISLALSYGYTTDAAAAAEPASFLSVSTNEIESRIATRRRQAELARRSAPAAPRPAASAQV